ncbi:MAG: hypothetical protein ACJ8HJ_19765 [Massilia sp.]
MLATDKYTPQLGPLVATQSMMGRMLADWTGETANPHLAALDHKTPSTLPAPQGAPCCAIGVRWP